MPCEGIGSQNSERIILWANASTSVEEDEPVRPLDTADLTIDWDELSDGSDCVLIDGFATDRDTGRPPEGTDYIYKLDHGAHCEDRAGERFRVIGHGSVQGSVVIEDRNGERYMTDTDVIVKEAE